MTSTQMQRYRAGAEKDVAGPLRTTGGAITLSARAAHPREENAIHRALSEARAAGRRLVDLTVSNPTEAALPYDDRAIVAALASPRVLRYEPAPLGAAEARACVCEELAREGTHVSPERVALFASTSEAYALLLKLLCDPGDDILVPAPSYPLFEALATLEGVRLRRYALAYDGAWHVDLQSVVRARTPRSRAVFVVSPNNPTGSVLRKGEFEGLEELGLPIVSDEVFAPYVLAPSAEHVRTAALAATRVPCFSLDGLSKRCALPQMKCAWAVLGGPDDAVAEARSGLEWVADQYLSVGAPVQHALGALFEATRRTRSARAARLCRNLRALRDAVAGSAASLLHVEAGWYATLRLPAVRSEQEWALRFLDAGVLVQPGWYFDFDLEPCVVLGLLAPEATFDEGVATVLDVVSAG
jgi:aspartate/methionine/tyrosine aminotransferase